MKLEIKRIENGYIVTRGGGLIDTTWYCQDKKELSEKIKVLMELI